MVEKLSKLIHIEQIKYTQEEFIKATAIKTLWKVLFLLLGP